MTTLPIKVLGQNQERVVKVDSSRAIQLIKTGNFIGKGSPTRVKILIEVETRKFEDNPHFWDDRPVFGKFLTPPTLCKTIGCTSPVEKWWDATNKQDRRCVYCRKHANVQP